MADYVTQFEEYKNEVKKEGEQLVKKVLPQKVMELNALYHSDLFKLSRLESIVTDVNIPIPEPPPAAALGSNGEEPSLKKRKQDAFSNDLPPLTGSRVYALPEGVVRCNKFLLQMIDLIKPQIRGLIDHANHIKMWISYQIPKVEDGNNFGVSIQEDTMAEARQVESEAATYLDQISRYFITRGKIISKVAKYPHVEDYRRTVQELDEKQFVSLRLVVCEIRNHYATLNDIIIKNMEKIKKPRSQNTDNMY